MINSISTVDESISFLLIYTTFYLVIFSKLLTYYITSLKVWLLGVQYDYYTKITACTIYIYIYILFWK